MISNHCDSWLLLQPFIFLFPQTPPSLLLTCPFTGRCLPFSRGTHVSVFLCQHQLPAAQCPYLASCLSFFFKPLFLERGFWQALLLPLCYNNRGSSKEKCWSLAQGDSSCNQCNFLRSNAVEASPFIDEACSSCSYVGTLKGLYPPQSLELSTSGCVCAPGSLHSALHSLG